MTKKTAFQKLTKRSFDKLRRSSAVFMSYCCLRRALRSQLHLITGRPALIVVVAEASLDLDVHKKAADFLRKRAFPCALTWPL